MNLNKLAPWNWFKHEDNQTQQVSSVPVHRSSLNQWSDDGTPLATGEPWLNMHRHIDRLFENTLSAFGHLPSGSGWRNNMLSELSAGQLPSIDIAADEHRYDITLDVPGMKASDIDIQVHDRVLTIRGQKQESHEDKDKHYYRMERRIGSFQRTLSLPVDAVDDDIHASIKDGVLKLEIPRREVANKDIKRIPISS